MRLAIWTSLFIFLLGCILSTIPWLTSLTSHCTTFSIADLHGHLFNFEARLASRPSAINRSPHSWQFFHITPYALFYSNGSGSGSNSFGPANPSTRSSNSILPTPNSAALSTSLASRSNFISTPNLTEVLALALLYTLPWQTQQQLATAYISQQLNRSHRRGGRARGRGKSYAFSGASQRKGNGSNEGQGRSSDRDNTVNLTCQICTKIVLGNGVP